MRGLILQQDIVKVVARSPLLYLNYFSCHLHEALFRNVINLIKHLILGMSDLLSPFVVLFEDDADAFWCFEMLLRRMVIKLKIDQFPTAFPFSIADVFGFTYSA